MSTPCRIIVKIDKSDINQSRHFNCSWPDNPLPYGEWISRFKNGDVYSEEFSNVCVCKDVKLKGEYIGVYCYWDGDTQSTGRILRKYFNTYEKALNLVLGGDISCMVCGVLKNYANRKDTEWKDVKPVQGALEDIRKEKYGLYEHIFEDGKWHSKKVK